MLGVELEFEVTNSPSPSGMYRTQWPIVHSYPKGHNGGYYHDCHGELVKLIEEGTDGFVRVGYDKSVADMPNGWELYSQPGGLLMQIQAWSELYDLDLPKYMNVAVTGVTPGGQPRSCGMHVHVSGDELGSITLANLLMFVNNRANAEFFLHVAGRWDTFYCKVKDITRENAFALFHSENCRYKDTRISEKQNYVNTVTTLAGGYQYKFCCDNSEQYQFQKQSKFWTARVVGPTGINFDQRLALNPTTTPGTGDCEFRMFLTPTIKSRCLANIEFVHALVKYCADASPQDTGYDNFCKWLMADTTRRTTYRNLFRLLRPQYVEGLIPKRSTDARPRTRRGAASLLSV